jgi:hypothetical protein
MNPPRWAEFLLQLIVRARDRETISGDLLEEYRESVLPAQGRFRARLWYWGQVLSFVSPLLVGLAFGTALGVWNLVSTAVDPLSDDSTGIMMTFVAVLVGTWGLVAFLAGRRRRSFRDAVVAGAIVGAATITMFNLANYIRVNVFLDSIQYRDDWRNLMARFHESDARSLRAFVNREYLTGTFVVTSLGAVAGGVSGLIGGAVSGMTRSSSTPKAHDRDASR